MSTSDHCINQTYFQSMEPRVLDDPIIQARHEQSQAGSTDPATVLTYLAFLEQKIGHLRGIICSTPHPQQQIVAAELSCIIVQLASISRNLIPGDPASAHGGEDDVKSSPPPCANAHEGSDSDHDHHVEEADVEHDSLPPGSYEVIQIEKQEILAPHVHYCKVCGKGFKRDANLRMHMRGHGDEYKTAAALAKPSSSPEAATATARRYFYSCPFVGCNRNKEHKKFQPLKSPICVKNHYRRSHCDKSYTCRRCNVKKFSVLADLRTHEKHCGRDRWVCSCGTSFSRKDKLFGHVAVFDGHTPALPADEDAADGGASGSDQPLLKDTTEAASRTASSSERFSESGFDGTCRSFDINGIDDGRGYLSPMGLDSCDFAGFDLFGAPAIDFWYQTET